MSSNTSQAISLVIARDDQRIKVVVSLQIERDHQKPRLLSVVVVACDRAPHIIAIRIEPDPDGPLRVVRLAKSVEGDAP